MCGIAGWLDLRGGHPAERCLLERMCSRLTHRGPDADGFFLEGPVGLGFRRLSILDLETGDQPIFNEDRSVVVLCNGEIFNFLELRAELEQKGHTFRTRSDVEVLVHLYEEHGVDLIGRLNGQFAFALWDSRQRRLLLARDPFGIAPLFYAEVDGLLLFASEIKAILGHPLAPRAVDLTGLDQVICLPGPVSPRTLFQGISSLPSGHWMVAGQGRVQLGEYWDLDYPPAGEAGVRLAEGEYRDRLAALLERSVALRLQADVPVGLYLSGGLDSSLVAALACRRAGEARHTFSIRFTERSIDESRYQRLMAERLGTVHHEIEFDWSEIAGRMRAMVYHAECPVRETYNTCSLALSEAAQGAGIKVVLGGEGADELFGGYPGYVFDQLGPRRNAPQSLRQLREAKLREKLWGSASVFYETDLDAVRRARAALYSEAVRGELERFDFVNFPLVPHARLAGRHPVHQRSYLDFKLRLADHLLADHGDRMALAHGVEGRYPFLDREVVDFVRWLPPDLKVHGFTEKYILKRLCASLLPAEIIEREKFGFRAPGSPYLLRQRLDWIEDQLSPERLRRQGYFDPETVAALRAEARDRTTDLNPHQETDLLMVVLTFGLLVDQFDLPALG